MSKILEVKDLSVDFHQHKQVINLVDKVSFSVSKGQCLGILGESGSGKSMSCKAIMRLLDKSFSVKGDVHFMGRDLLAESSESVRKLRGSKVCMVLQNPMNCFDPLYRIDYQMAETFAEHTNMNGAQIREKSLEILHLMQIRDPEDVLRKYPHQLSGGMLQRVMIGLALALKPTLLIADEPTTAIDSISQYAIMQEFLRIKKSGQVGMIFISHDLGVLSSIADDLMVMYKGKAVEHGPAVQVFEQATDAYTRDLISQHKAVMRRFLTSIYGNKRTVAA